MVSDWLELDSVDSWVRHDSEIVGVLHCRCRRRWLITLQYLPGVCDFTRLYSKSSLTRHTWMCKPQYFHPLAIAVRLRPTDVPSTAVSRGLLTCKFPSDFPSMIPLFFRQPLPRSPPLAFRVTNRPPSSYRLPLHRRRFAHRDLGRCHQQKHQSLS